MYSELEHKIIDAATRYYTDGSSPLTDNEFDRLIEQLKIDKPESELLTKTGWGYDPTKSPMTKTGHKYGLVGSLPKCHNYEELNSNFKEFNDKIYISLKLDGLSVVLYYEKGKLVDAVTRGDGHIGISIIDKVLVIAPNLATISDITFTGAVRGEIIMTLDDFESYLEMHPDASNPRNVSAGIINRVTVDTEELKFLSIIVYSIVGLTKVDLSHLGIAMTYDMREIYDWLTKMFPNNIVPNDFIYSNEIRDLDNIMQSYRLKWYGKYPADGIVLNNACVVTTDNNDLKYFNYNGQAYKFPAETATTNIVNVEWNMSRLGYCIPKIQVHPVSLSGTTVQFCTGFNYKYIVDNNLGVGSAIEMTKSGEIIPYITKIIKSTSAEPPRVCPHCGEPLVVDGVHLKCINTRCDNMNEKDLTTWIMSLVECDNVGEKVLLSEIYDCIDDEYKCRPLTVDDIMTDTIMHKQIDDRTNTSSIRKSQFNEIWNTLIYDGKFTLYQALMALNIPRLGDKTSYKLAQMYDVVNRIRKYEITESELASKIGDANAKSILENMDKFFRINYIWNRIEMPSKEFAPLDNGTVVITGKLSIPRKQFESELMMCGYTTSSTVNKDTKFLITDNPNSSSSKNKKANELGIPKITEQEFRDKYMIQIL